MFVVGFIDPKALKRLRELRELLKNEIARLSLALTC